MFYRICPCCGAYLDPGEACDCIVSTCNQKNDYKKEDCNA